MRAHTPLVRAAGTVAAALTIALGSPDGVVRAWGQDTAAEAEGTTAGRTAEAASTQGAREALERTLREVDAMSAGVARTLADLRRLADEALAAAEAADDASLADRQMRLHFDLATRIAEIEGLEADLARQADLLRTRLEEVSRP